MKIHGPSLLFLVTTLLAVSSLPGAEPPKKTKPAARTSPPVAQKPAGPDLADPVALVDGEPIKKAELERALNGMLAQSGKSLDDIPPQERMNAYRVALDDTIAEKLIAKQAAKIEVPDAEVDAIFNRFKTNFGSDEELKAQIEKSGQTVEKVKVQIRGSLRAQHWVADQVKGKDTVTDAEAEEFYKQNPAQFQAPEQVRASHILISVPANASPEVVIEKEKKAKEILGRVQKGEPFDKLAKEVSEDPSAKENSGDLNFFGRQQMVPEFSEAAFKLKKDEIAGPVRSQFGYHIIKATDRKDPESISLEIAKPKLLAFLQQRKKQTEVEQIVRDLRKKADVKINLPASAAPSPLEGAAPPAKK